MAKLSGWVKFNVWNWLVTVLLSIPLNFEPGFLPGLQGFQLTLIQIVLTGVDAAALVAAVYVLKGREWARGFFVVLCYVYIALGILYIPFLVRFMEKDQLIPQQVLAANKTLLTQSYQSLSSDHPLRAQMTEQQYIESVIGMAMQAGKIAAVVCYALLFAYLFFLVWYFNRPKIKAQFDSP
jgi:hypothetical protein